MQTTTEDEEKQAPKQDDQLAPQSPTQPIVRHAEQHDEEKIEEEREERVEPT